MWQLTITSITTNGEVGSRLPQNKVTFDLLTAAGFTAVDEASLCSNAAHLLFPNRSHDCEALFEMITSWRDLVIKSFVSQVDVG